LEFKVQQIYPSDTYPGYQAGTDPKSVCKVLDKETSLQSHQRK